MKNFIFKGGSCRPCTFEYLDLFKGLQRDINRIRNDTGRPLICVDGRIGSQTLKAVNDIQVMTYSSCTSVAESIKDVGPDIRKFANSFDRANVADPDDFICRVFSKPSEKKSDGTIIHPKITISGFAGVPWWAIALLGGGAYTYYKYESGGKIKNQKRPSKKSLLDFGSF